MITSPKRNNDSHLIYCLLIIFTDEITGVFIDSPLQSITSVDGTKKIMANSLCFN